MKFVSNFRMKTSFVDNSNIKNNHFISFYVPFLEVNTLVSILHMQHSKGHNNLLYLTWLTNSKSQNTKKKRN